MKRASFCRLAALVLALLVVAAAPPVAAASGPPVRARNGMVVAVEENAARAGVEVLKQGGNAADAAIATALALAVTHPAAGNIGGGGFLLLRFADGQTTFIDFRERAPGRATRDMYLDASDKVVAGASTIGILAAGVPGTVAGLDYASRKYGKLAWEKLVAPAIALAEKGCTLSYEQARSLSNSARLLGRFPESRRIFLRDGRYYQMGEVFAQPDLAQTLKRIQAGGAREFYQGGTARRIAEFSKKNGGLITLEDLNKYEVAERRPLAGAYRGYEIISAPPPSCGGALLNEMLNILEGVPLQEKGWGSADAIHWTVEAMRRAFADRAAYMGDTDFAKVPVRGMTDKKYAQALRAGIDPQHAGDSRQVRAGNPLGYEPTETTHLSVVDKDGNAAALTYTLNGGYGNGMTVEGAGFLLNNEMDDFTSKPGTPNMYGAIQSEANAIAPGKRPLSSMTPTMVTREGKLVLVTGSPGGTTIPNTVLNVLLNVIDYGMGIQQAVDAPRFHHQWLPDQVVMESGFSPDTKAILKARGHKFAADRSIGDAHSIMVDTKNNLLLGAADPRLGGKAVGY